MKGPLEAHFSPTTSAGPASLWPRRASFIVAAIQIRAPGRLAGGASEPAHRGNNYCANFIYSPIARSISIRRACARRLRNGPAAEWPNGRMAESPNRRFADPRRADSRPERADRARNKFALVCCHVAVGRRPRSAPTCANLRQLAPKSRPAAAAAPRRATGPLQCAERARRRVVFSLCPPTARRTVRLAGRFLCCATWGSHKGQRRREVSMAGALWRRISPALSSRGPDGSARARLMIDLSHSPSRRAEAKKWVPLTMGRSSSFAAARRGSKGVRAAPAGRLLPPAKRVSPAARHAPSVALELGPPATVQLD